MDKVLEEEVLRAWQANASPWVQAVRDGSIESRRLVTDAAIIAAITSLPGNSVLDIGCGEGWLCRALSAQGYTAMGIDAVPGLVEKAQQGDRSRYRVLAYEQLSRQVIGERFDLMVCNFSLIGKVSSEAVVAAAFDLLHEGGHLLIQTLNPRASCGELPYVDGWREGSWQGCGENFSDPAPWYFRTEESWLALLAGAGLELQQQLAPRHPTSQRPVSLILVAQKPV